MPQFGCWRVTESGYALERNGDAAFFVIKAVDASAVPRKVEWLDGSRVFCGPVVREGEQAFVWANREVPL